MQPFSFAAMRNTVRSIYTNFGLQALPWGLAAVQALPWSLAAVQALPWSLAAVLDRR
ncbi:hypothetical protein [Mesorhizobium sp.]|uniref:hypothetical protein n=1 Tax=Mesorhizobium sp. TaxID=1871066 RepID=UPI00257BF243|nr:hypothetical protein [Mesorhizobium sp.]